MIRYIKALFAAARCYLYERSNGYGHEWSVVKGRDVFRVVISNRSK